MRKSARTAPASGGSRRAFRTLLALGCSLACSPVARVASNGHDASPRRFRVECIELEQCKARASSACRSPYVVESEWHNDIPESDLPGLNESSRPKDAREWLRPSLPLRTGIESSDPMPLVSLVVVCTESYAYLDGFGRTRVTLAEAELLGQ